MAVTRGFPGLDLREWGLRAGHQSICGDRSGFAHDRTRLHLNSVKKWGLTEQTAFFRELRFGKSIPCGSEKRCQFRQSPFFGGGQ